MKKKITFMLIVILAVLCTFILISYLKDTPEEQLVQEDKQREIDIEKIESLGFDSSYVETTDAERVALAFNELGIQGVIVESKIADNEGVPDEVYEYNVDKYFSILSGIDCYTAVVIDGEVIYWR